jgi:hypothetical protein
MQIETGEQCTTDETAMRTPADRFCTPQAVIAFALSA